MSGKRFSKKEIDFLYAAHNKYTVVEVASMLGRTEKSVYSKVSCLNKEYPENKIELKRMYVEASPTKDMSSWREETSCTAVCICSSIRRGESIDQIAKDLKRPPEQVEYIYQRSLKDGVYKSVDEYQKKHYF